MWSKVLEFAGVKNTVFDPHVRYPDHIFTQLARACTVLIGEGDHDDYMVFFGRCVGCIVYILLFLSNLF